MVIGVAYGGISGYYGGRVDDIMQRIVEILYGIPTFSCRYTNASNLWNQVVTAIIIAITYYRLDWYVPNCSWSSIEIQKSRICIWHLEL